MDTSKKVVIAFARKLMGQVIVSNPMFTREQVITHTVEGTCEKYLLDHEHAQVVREALEDK